MDEELYTLLNNLGDIRNIVNDRKNMMAQAATAIASYDARRLASHEDDFLTELELTLATFHTTLTFIANAARSQRILSGLTDLKEMMKDINSDPSETDMAAFPHTVEEFYEDVMSSLRAVSGPGNTNAELRVSSSVPESTLWNVMQRLSNDGYTVTKTKDGIYIDWFYRQKEIANQNAEKIDMDTFSYAVELYDRVLNDIHSVTNSNTTHTEVRFSSSVPEDVLKLVIQLLSNNNYTVTKTKGGIYIDWFFKGIH